MAERIPTPLDERSWFSQPQGVAMLWAGLLAGPAAWALDLGVSYALVKWACSSQRTAVLHLITIGALAITAGGALAAWNALQRTPGDALDDGARPPDRGRFMAVLGLVMSALFALTILANDLPRVMLDACL
jgi:hypothetical protein